MNENRIKSFNHIKRFYDDISDFRNDLKYNMIAEYRFKNVKEALKSMLIKGCLMSYNDDIRQFLKDNGYSDYFLNRVSTDILIDKYHKVIWNGIKDDYQVKMLLKHNKVITYVKDGIDITIDGYYRVDYAVKEYHGEYFTREFFTDKNDAIKRVLEYSIIANSD